MVYQVGNVNRRPLPSPSVFSCERIYYLIRQYVSGKAIEGFLFMNDQNSFDETISLLDSRFDNKYI